MKSYKYNDFETFWNESGIQETDAFKYLDRKFNFHAVPMDMEALKSIVRNTWALVAESAYTQGKLDGKDDTEEMTEDIASLIDSLSKVYGT